ncbi:DUF6295 family protein [Modestobacter sp. NPDC049651]|uniref:DUF6295 family protein n=1 Tax=unclassified Modestobacter TaxID=2643866 RepID=UPI00340B72E4
MCTYQTATLPLTGAGKGASGWFPLTAATVYFDHPVSAPQAHTLNIDFRNPDRGAAARVAVELDPAGARQLAESILAMLDAAPPGLVEESMTGRS